MTAEKVTLTEEKETLLITLYAKAGECRLPDSLLHDHFAAAAVEQIDYDFSKLKVDRDLMIAVALRGHIFDGWTRDFLARHPEATVLHLGCGLDSRIFRLEPRPGVRWFDVDYPEVIALRRRLYPQRDGYALIGAPITAPDWLEELPADRPAMIIAEGLFMYLEQYEVEKLLRRITAHFSTGEVAFDTFSRLGVRLLKMHPSIRATGAAMHGNVENPRQLENRVHKLKLISGFTAYDPRAYDPRQVARMSWKARLGVRILGAVPPLGRIAWLLHYRF